ncbi:unnamed protein product, partial [Staurois parvus]
MQTASTNICERLCSKSICEISLLLNVPRSTVSGIITKWKQLGTTATLPFDVVYHVKWTEWDQHMLKRTVRRSCKLSAESIAKDLQTSCGLETRATVFTVLHGMGFHGPAAGCKPYITKCNAKHRTLEQKRRVLW